MAYRLTRRSVACCAGAVVLAAGLAASPGPASAQNGEPIRIGFSMAVTGPLAPNGKQALLGAKIWEEEINAKGGLHDIFHAGLLQIGSAIPARLHQEFDNIMNICLAEKRFQDLIASIFLIRRSFSLGPVIFSVFSPAACVPLSIRLFR